MDLDRHLLHRPRSSREVSDAINSMFRCYREAEVCLAYLQDVPTAEETSAFTKSEWFRRGWTLQELLAPTVVVFLAADWQLIGHKGQDGCGRTGIPMQTGALLDNRIAAITQIPLAVLQDYNTSHTFSIDDKLLWMRYRETTREEDLSYCLLGILGISMNIRYGDGADKTRARMMKKAQSLASYTSTQSGRNTNHTPIHTFQHDARYNEYVHDSRDSQHTYHNVESDPPERSAGEQALSSAISTVPFPRDYDFVNRPELAILIETIVKPGTRVVLSGIGGVGKSQLAIELCYRLRSTYNLWVFWIHASSAERFDKDIRGLAEDLSIPGCQESAANVYQLVSKWLKDSRRKWLIVLDNADDSAILFSPCSTRGDARPRIEYLPPCEHGTMLVTTRTQSVAMEIADINNIIEVKPSKEHAIALLQSKLGDLESTSADELCNRLDYIPLAIAHAAAYIRLRQPSYTAEHYLDELRNTEVASRILSTDFKNTRRDRLEASNSPLLTFEITFEHIQDARRQTCYL